MCTGVMRVFSESGVVERALETASTFEGSWGAFFGVSVGSFGGGGGVLPGGLEEYAGILRFGGACFGKRPRGPGGEGVARVAKARVCGRGSRNDHLNVGSIAWQCFRFYQSVSKCYLE